MTAEEAFAKLEEFKAALQPMSGSAADWLLFDVCLNTLKLGRPRVMSRSEVIYSDYPVMIERNPRLIADYPAWAFYMRSASGRMIFHLRGGNSVSYRGSEYGETWRCWSGYATKAQRGATPWEE